MNPSLSSDVEVKRDRKAVFLDRDGVLNQAIIINGKPHSPNNIEELILTPNIEAPLLYLRHLGFLLICVTNQPDAARGTVKLEQIEQINLELCKLLPLDDLLVCYHDDVDQCLCRKPKPGLLLQAAEKHHIDLAKSFMVGDRWRDIDAGKAAGCKTIWIQDDYNEKTPDHPDYICKHLNLAVDWISKFL